MGAWTMAVALIAWSVGFSGTEKRGLAGAEDSFTAFIHSAFTVQFSVSCSQLRPASRFIHSWNWSYHPEPRIRGSGQAWIILIRSEPRIRGSGQAWVMLIMSEPRIRGSDILPTGPSLGSEARMYCRFPTGSEPHFPSLGSEVTLGSESDPRLGFLQCSVKNLSLASGAATYVMNSN